MDDFPASDFEKRTMWHRVGIGIHTETQAAIRADRFGDALNHALFF